MVDQIFRGRRLPCTDTVAVAEYQFSSPERLKYEVLLRGHSGAQHYRICQPPRSSGSNNDSSSGGDAVLHASDKIVCSTVACHCGTLRKTSTVKAVNNLWVGLQTGQSRYALAGTQAAATKFFVRMYKPTGTYSFYDGDDTRQLYLVGSYSALLHVINNDKPIGDTIPGGHLVEWATFTMDDDVLGVNDGRALRNRTFVAVSGVNNGYGLALYDGR